MVLTTAPNPSLGSPQRPLLVSLLMQPQNRSRIYQKSDVAIPGNFVPVLPSFLSLLYCGDFRKPPWVIKIGSKKKNYENLLKGYAFFVLLRSSVRISFKLFARFTTFIREGGWRRGKLIYDYFTAYVVYGVCRRYNFFTLLFSFSNCFINRKIWSILVDFVTQKYGFFRYNLESNVRNRFLFTSRIRLK